MCRRQSIGGSGRPNTVQSVRCLCKHHTDDATTEFLKSFSDDPLTRWLRPGAAPWGAIDTRSMSWQQRRVERVLLEGEIHVAVDLEPEGGDQGKSTAVCSAVGILHPPDISWLQRFRSLLVHLRLAALGYIRPLEDENDANLKVRVIQDDFF